MIIVKEEYTAITDDKRWYVRLTLADNPNPHQSTSVAVVRVSAEDELATTQALGVANLLGLQAEIDHSLNVVHIGSKRLRVTPDTIRMRPFASIITLQTWSGLRTGANR